jgi:Family of unknown function (DUF5329)
MALAAPSTAARAEIEHLMDYLAGSGCEFYRNGKWYPARQAVDHIRRKYDYLLKRDLVDTTEHFIERAAAASSRSGKPYKVRCASGQSVDSAQWLTQELARHRATRQ